MAYWSHVPKPTGTLFGDGAYTDLTGLGPQTSFTVDPGIRRISIQWSQQVTTITWPDARTTDAVGVTQQGFYNEFPTNPAFRRDAGRVVSDGTVEVYDSGGQDAVAPVAVDVWLMR